MAKGLLHEQPEVLDFRIANVERVHVRGVPLHHGRIALLASHLSNFLFPAKSLYKLLAFFFTKLTCKVAAPTFCGVGCMQVQLVVWRTTPSPPYTLRKLDLIAVQ